MEQTITTGNYVIIQRQGYTKLYKVKQNGKLVLGSFNIEMDNIIGAKYSDTFQMKNVPNKKLYNLEKVQGNNVIDIKSEKCGEDNRNITNDGDSQALTRDEIDKLKEQDFSASTIVEQLITNSKTFQSKTEYSQEKYIKKKQKKYYEYIQIRKPTVRLLAQMFYRQDPMKTLGIRCDDLSQILTLANIHSEGNHLLYDSGTCGLLAAAFMNSIGSNTTGQLIHMHPGNECQKNAFIAMEFPEEQSNRCINVNLYSVLRCFYQQNDKESDEPLNKKPKLEPKKHWEIDNEKACVLLKNKVDSLVLATKEHPVNLVKELLQFLNGNRNIVVFSICKEPLQELYLYLKSRLDIINIKISNNFLRNYQVLPNRTHPEVNMNSGGFILSAYKLSC